MKVFFDTSVLVAAVVEAHDEHERSFSALERARTGRDEGCVGAHTLAEMYSVLTGAPLPFRHTPQQALLSIEENVAKYCTVVALTGTDYLSLLRDCALTEVKGGAVFDALLLRTAKKANAQRIYTLNLKHFQRLGGELLSVITAP